MVAQRGQDVRENLVEHLEEDRIGKTEAAYGRWVPSWTDPENPEHRQEVDENEAGLDGMTGKIVVPLPVVSDQVVHKEPSHRQTREPAEQVDQHGALTRLPLSD